MRRWSEVDPKARWALVAVVVVAAVGLVALAGVLRSGDDQASGAPSTEATTPGPDPTTTALPSPTSSPTTAPGVADPSTTTTTAPPAAATPTPTTTSPATPGGALLSQAGTGSTVITLPEPLDETEAAHLVHTGTGSFSVQSVAADGSELETLADATGRYEGVRPIGLDTAEPVAAIAITTDGPWQVELDPLDDLASADPSPGAVTAGSGDAFLRFPVDGDTPVHFSCPGCDGSVIVRAISSHDDLPVITDGGPFDGDAVVPAGTLLLNIATNGPDGPQEWTLTVG